MIYIVSGMPRSGTSMMMRALHAGGIPVPEITHDSEHMELPRTVLDCGIDGFYDNKLVKVFGNRIDVLRDLATYRVIYMLRDPEHILESYWRKWPHGAPGVDFPKTVKPLQTLQTDALAAWMKRPNVDLLPLDYAAVIEDPDIFMEGISHKGFPIEPSEAAKSIILGAKDKIILSH